MRPKLEAPVADKRRFKPLYAGSGKDDRSGHRHRFIVGMMGLLMPPVVWLIAALLRKDLSPLPSLSAYYYTGSVAVLVGVLAVLAVYLFSYQGYRNKYAWVDRLATVTAGIAASLVALFPTKAPNGIPSPLWWAEYMGTIHGSAAIVLFCAFIVFALYLFPKSTPGSVKTTEKTVRNAIFYVCGGVMLCCIAWTVISLRANTSIFWPESLAIEFFGISWLAKGRADRTLVSLRQRAWYYSRNPKHAVEDLRLFWGI